MANMSYCRMENTYNDLLDVLKNWDNTSSETELEHREEILKLCRNIINSYDEEHQVVSNERLDELEEYELNATE